MRFQPGNVMNPKGRPKGLGVTGWLKRVLAEKGPDGMVNYEVAVRRAVKILTSGKTGVRDFVSLLGFVTDRIEGKPIGVDLVGSLHRDNPLVELDTDILLDRLEKVRRQKLIEHGTDQEKAG